jgi:hypothetical protein
VRVVRPLNTAQLVTEAPFGNFTPNSESGQVRPHGPPQVVQGKVRDSMFDPPPERRSRCRCRRAAFVDGGRAASSGKRTRYRQRRGATPEATESPPTPAE